MKFLKSIKADISAGIYLRFVLLWAAMGLVLRVALILHPLTDMSGAGPAAVACVLLLGVLNDVFTATIAYLPLWAFCLSACRRKFRAPQSYVWLAALAVVFVLTLCSGTLREFNKPLHRILCWVAAFWFMTFAVRMLVPRIRDGWMRFWLAVIIGIYLCLSYLDAASEWFFWNEFGVRYNFIAVDYLVYTSEVVGNIIESYPVGWLFAGILALTAATEFLLFRRPIARAPEIHSQPGRLAWALAYPVLAVVSAAGLALVDGAGPGDNAFCRELQASGPYSFCKAFMRNTIEYDKFYLCNTPQAIDADMSRLMWQTPEAADSSMRPNIVLITMESMSADYMRRFGGERALTPTLDSLYSRSLAFDRMFAAGNRTVRGLEALTLCRPPAAGESLIKRHGLPRQRSVADILEARGYSLTFLYGGDSYFDNMGEFFSSLGYDIADSGCFADSEVSCRTVWGICDGDVYDKLIDIASEKAGSETPFFIHMLTTSNHRPYIYPEGKISIPPSAQTRDGGVMYSDFALGEFMRKAVSQPWFDNTVFVVVADHCASSAGKTELPLANYHIPALVYAPAMVSQQTVDTVSSQIDLMPTLFALLGWGGDDRMHGRDILSPSYIPRAFVATYQDLGYLTRDTLTVLSPGRKAAQYTVDGDLGSLRLGGAGGQSLSEAVSLYQSSAEPAP